MAQPYVKQEWADKVTLINKSRLDHIEEGIYQNSITKAEPGPAGKDGVTPQLKLEGDYIQVSLDNGGSWSNLVPLASITGPQGPEGKAFSIYKTYPSVEAMNQDASNVPEGSFVLIASTEDDPDNAKLYVKGSDAFTYMSDLSGAQGIEGPAGKDGTPGITPVISVKVTTLEAGEEATVTQEGSVEAPVLTFGIPRGKDGTNGQNGSDGVNGADGKNGVTFTPSVDPDGNLSWTNDGDLENPETVNIKGPAGEIPDLENVVRYQSFVAGASPDERKTIQFENGWNLSGKNTAGDDAANLIMLSQWDKVDIGSTRYQMNLNSPDGVVQINDEKVVATTDQVEALGVHSLGNFSSSGQAEAQAAVDGVFNNPAYNVLVYTVNGENGQIINSVGASQTKQFLYWQGKRYTRTVAKVEDDIQVSAWASDDGYVALPNRAVMPTLFSLTTEADSDTVKAALTSTQSNEAITLDDLNKCLQTGYVLRYYAMQSGSVFVGFNGQAFTLTYIGFANPTQDPAVMSICINVTADGVYSVTRNGTKGILLTSKSSVITDLSTKVSTLETTVDHIGNTLIPEMNTNTAKALDAKVSWDQEKKVISLPKDGCISAMRGDPLEGTQPEGGNLLAQRTYDEGATYVTEVGTTKNKLTLNASERPQIDLQDADSEKVAYLSEIEALKKLLPAEIAIPIRGLQDKVYDQATIFDWFGVEDIAGLRKLFTTNRMLWMRYGITSMSLGHMMYRFVIDYAEVNKDGNTIKLMFRGLNTSNDKLADYVFTAKLDGTVVSGNSNVSLVVTDKE